MIQLTIIAMIDNKKNTVVLEKDNFQTLLELLSQKGYEIIGPTICEGAVIYDKVSSLEELPIGLKDIQEAGGYQLVKSDNNTLFGYTISPQSWKKFLYPPVQKLWEAERTKSGFKIANNGNGNIKRAFLGVRACELAAISIQDKVFAEGQFADSLYRKNRENAFIIAVNCTHAGDTCFCVSMNTGPGVSSGYDLALTEVVDGDKHYFVFESGSKAGAEILKETPHKTATDKEIETAEKAVKDSAAHMGRSLNTNGLKELLIRNFNHPYWETIATRCLTCGNCTMVCPTCFCTTMEDTTDLTGKTAQRWRKWDSCFTMDFSYIAGGSIRASAMSRYRQWLTHKLANWHDQFGISGCVGCGRCITWCPVGIDITEEAQFIRENEINISVSNYKKDVKNGNA